MNRRAKVIALLDAEQIEKRVEEQYGSGSRFKYEGLMAYLEMNERSVEGRAYFSTFGLNERRGGLFCRIKRAGFDVKLRPAKRLPSGEVKSTVDASIAFDLGRDVERHGVRRVFLVSGDSDFAPLCAELKEAGVDVVVVGPPDSTSWELILAASAFCTFDDLDLVEKVHTTRATAVHPNPGNAGAAQPTNGPHPTGYLAKAEVGTNN